MLRNLKTVIRVLGLVWLGVGCGMGIAQLFFGWSPTHTDELVRVVLTVLGMVLLAFDGMLPG